MDEIDVRLNLSHWQHMARERKDATGKEYKVVYQDFQQSYALCLADTKTTCETVWSTADRVVDHGMYALGMVLA